MPAVDLSEEEFQQLEELSKSHPPKRVCDQSDSEFYTTQAPIAEEKLTVRLRALLRHLPGERQGVLGQGAVRPGEVRRGTNQE